MRFRLRDARGIPRFARNDGARFDELAGFAMSSLSAISWGDGNCKGGWWRVRCLRVSSS
jgi:hypothetical protein